MEKNKSEKRFQLPNRSERLNILENCLGSFYASIKKSEKKLYPFGNFLSPSREAGEKGRERERTLGDDSRD
jgi:hypothetical protein